MRPEDVINQTTGILKYLYYAFIDKFHIRPRDMSDFIDGLLYMSGVSYIQKQEYDRLQRLQDIQRQQGR